MTMEESVNVSIEAALASGRIDGTVHAAPIQALRELAKRADVASERDNVTFPTMLKYMAALGILPEVDEAASAKPKAGGSSSLHRMRGKFRAVQ